MTPPMSAPETVSIKHCDMPWSTHTSPKVTFGGQYSMFIAENKIHYRVKNNKSLDKVYY